MVLTQAQEIVAQSELSQEDKQMWFVHFEKAPEEVLQIFVTLFETSPENLPIATNSLKKKLAAAGNVQKMQHVMREEKQIVTDAVAEDAVRERINSQVNP